MVVEPPGNLRRGRILEVDNGILIAGKVALVEESSGSVHQPVILIFDGRVKAWCDALPVEPCKQRSGASPIKAFVVIKDANPQAASSPKVRSSAATRSKTTAIAEVFSIRAGNAGVKRRTAQLLTVSARSSTNPHENCTSLNRVSYRGINPDRRLPLL